MRVLCVLGQNSGAAASHNNIIVHAHLRNIFAPFFSCALVKHQSNLVTHLQLAQHAHTHKNLVRLVGAFKLYDVDNDGYITREEMYDIVGAIYEMLGTAKRAQNADDTGGGGGGGATGGDEAPNVRVDRIFELLDTVSILLMTLQAHTRARTHTHTLKKTQYQQQQRERKLVALNWTCHCLMTQASDAGAQPAD